MKLNTLFEGFSSRLHKTELDSSDEETNHNSQQTFDLMDKHITPQDFFNELHHKLETSSIKGNQNRTRGIGLGFKWYINSCRELNVLEISEYHNMAISDFVVEFHIPDKDESVEMSYDIKTNDNHNDDYIIIQIYHLNKNIENDDLANDIFNKTFNENHIVGRNYDVSYSHNYQILSTENNLNRLYKFIINLFRKY